MSQANRFFHHEERSAYELAYLLRDLPRNLNAGSELSADQLLQVDAADSHSDSYADILLHGMEAMGHFIYSASDNENNPVDPKYFTQVGALISQLSCQLQFVIEFQAVVAGRKLELALKGQAK